MIPPIMQICFLLLQIGLVAPDHHSFNSHPDFLGIQHSPYNPKCERIDIGILQSMVSSCRGGFNNVLIEVASRLSS